jgi:predicted phage terminase large subunit-like protein
MTKCSDNSATSLQASLHSLQLLKKEMDRRTARKSLLAFTEYTNPLYQVAPHHRLIADKLEAIERGDIDRLMIFMPPRHGKSELASVRFPAWYMGRNPSNIKATIGPREWSALYQQRPQPDEGTFFQRGWFKEWEAKPALRYYGSSDYAVTDGDGDYTVHRVWGIDAAGCIYRVDGWRGQATSDVWIEKKLDLIAKYKPLAWFGEGGVIQKAVEPMLRRRMRERKTFCRLEWLPSVHDKPTRARSFQAMAASGRVYFEQQADLSEFLSFPAGKHDDEVDTASLIGRAIDQAHPAIVAIKKPDKPRDAWAMKDEEDTSWKVM